MASAPRSAPHAFRAVGLVYLLYFLAAFGSTYLSKGLVAAGDATATANNLLAHESAYRAGISVGLVANALYVALTALFYRVFAPVNANVSLIAAFLGVAGCTVQIVGSVFQLAPLVILHDNGLQHLFPPEQLHAGAGLSLALHGQVFHLSLVLFAIYDLLIGILIVKSTFLPRILGGLMMLAGLGWLTFLWPPLAAASAVVVLPLGALAEIALMLWLLVKGAGTAMRSDTC